MQHLENHLHQFALYLKSTHQNFPDSLLQQYNFDTAITEAPVEVSEETTNTDEPKKEVAVEPQAKVETCADDQSDQPKEESVKSAAGSSPTEEEEELKKELKEPPAKTSSKSRKKAYYTRR